MKALILETGYMLTCVLFWIVALSLAPVALPIAAIVSRVNAVLREDLANLARYLTMYPA